MLKVFSGILDEDLENKRPLPCRILDAGSGVGVLGICAAGAIKAAVSPMEHEKSSLYVRAQDRDELARVFSEYNARQNNLGPEILEAFTEPLLAGSGPWDLILSNIPAKAGLPVLEDFINRSAALLNPGGRALIVAVNTLSDFFDHQIQTNALLLNRNDGPGYTVYVYTRKEDSIPLTYLTKDDFFIQCPAYIRNRANYEMEKTSYHLETIHGAAGFDTPSGEVLAAAKLTLKLKKEIQDLLIPHSSLLTPNFLILEPDQGHFSTWLVHYLKYPMNMVLAGRNILSLTMARYNTSLALEKYFKTETYNEKFNIISTGTSVQMISAADLYLEKEKILTCIQSFDNEIRAFPFIAAFPELIPQTSTIEYLWKGIKALASGLIIISFSSAEAERFDKKKPKGFTRLGDIRRNGFRALAYRKLL